MNLIVLNDIFGSGLNYSSLDIITLISLICGITVIISKNPIVSVLFLIGLFLSIAVYLMMLGLTFIGLSYLLVYVGAVSILFLFILMLINVRISELVTDNNNSIPLGIFIITTFNLVYYKLLPYSQNQSNYNLFSNVWHEENYFSSLTNITYNQENLYYATAHIWDGIIAESSHITSIGNVIYTVYPIWLILTSIILLLAMVGAIVITLKS